MAKRALRVMVYRDRRGGWRFRIVSGNGQIVAQGQAYTRLASAKRGADRVLAHNGGGLTVRDFAAKRGAALVLARA